MPATICGIPIVNAGIGGADIRYIVRYSDELLCSSAPKFIVLAIGINDAHEDTFPFFRYRYQAAVVSRGTVLLATVAHHSQVPSRKCSFLKWCLASTRPSKK